MIAIEKLYPHFKDTTKRNKKVYVNKMKLNDQISAINRKWNNRKIEQQARQLQKAAGNNNMKPLWNYQKNRKKYNNNQKIPQYTQKMERKHTTLRKHYQDGRNGYNNTFHKHAKNATT